MAAINDLINQIQDPALRAKIEQEVDKLTKQKKFGLVFEEHLPECTALYDVPVRKGSTVARKSDKKLVDILTVVKKTDSVAVCMPKESNHAVEIPVTDLVTIAEFGESIYPYLKPLDSVCNAPDSDLWHTLIEADNYHALQLLEYLYAGKVDCIYIDPPYNKEDSNDWKYNCNYVDKTDEYRHSKWLSMMQKRLRIAKKLLNPNDSVLIVTIDEKEYLHLGCLLEEMFAEGSMQMVSSVINPSGVSRNNEFYRTDEYIFIIRFGSCVPKKMKLSDEWITANTTGKDKLRWRRIRRQGSHDTRSDAPNQFYPIYITSDGKQYAGAGESLPLGANKESVVHPDNVIVVWPIKPDGTEGCWQISQQSLKELFEKGYIKITWTKKWGYTPQYLAKGEREKVEAGQFPVIGTDQYGTIITADSVYDAPFVPGTQWRISTHNAREHGAKLLRKIFGSKPFDYPKSLYAVADVLRFFVAEKPNALVVDFFAGSGTTLHAVNLLNAEDGGKRRCIMVTNNEISAEEEASLKDKGCWPGDEEWDKLGIARYVTWPRTVCSIKGTDINGDKLNGEYFLSKTHTTLTKHNVTQVSFIESFSALSIQDKKNAIQLISHGLLPSKVVKPESGYIVSDNPKHTVSVLTDTSFAAEWIEEVSQFDHINELFIITRDKSLFNKIKRQIDESLEPAEKIVPMKKSMADGFKANVAFFKLGFLDKTKVSLGMQFKELLSTLWMKAGAYGPCPTIDGDSTPTMLILPKNRFAVLTEEAAFPEFEATVHDCPEIETVYIVTDYETAYRTMARSFDGKETYQLYRDYLDNFRINTGRN